MNMPSLSVRLFGTEEPVAPPELLKAGPLTAELEAGNLRYIRYRRPRAAARRLLHRAQQELGHLQSRNLRT